MASIFICMFYNIYNRFENVDCVHTRTSSVLFTSVLRIWKINGYMHVPILVYKRDTDMVACRAYLWIFLRRDLVKIWLKDSQSCLFDENMLDHKENSILGHWGSSNSFLFFNDVLNGHTYCSLLSFYNLFLNTGDNLPVIKVKSLGLHIQTLRKWPF